MDGGWMDVDRGRMGVWEVDINLQEEQDPRLGGGRVRYVSYRAMSVDGSTLFWGQAFFSAGCL